MASYKEQLTFVRSHDLESNNHIRTDCPYCNGSNTLSITREHGYLKWLCFKASCNVKGIEGVGRTSKELHDWLSDSTTTEDKPFELPSHLIPATGNRDCVNYLSKNNCLEAYTKRLVDIRYDPKQHRAVFVVYSKGHIVDAVGRALDYKDKPKWFRYGSSGKPLIVGTHSCAVLVEDAASACAVSPYATGVALMGTNIQYSQLSDLRQFDSLKVALDADATRKAISFQKLLNYYTRSTILRMDDEFKDLPKDKIKEKLSNV